MARLPRRRNLEPAVQPGQPDKPAALAILAAGAGTAGAGAVPAAVPAAAWPARRWLRARQNARPAAGDLWRMAARQPWCAVVFARERLAVRGAADRAGDHCRAA